MTAEIIPITPRRRSTIARADAIRKALKKQLMMDRKSERQKVGENMWRILNRLETVHQISKAKVLHEAGFGRKEESTKRLPLFAINPDLDVTARIKKTEVLTKTTSKYLRIVEAAANLAKLPIDDLLVGLFAGTSYEQGRSDYSDSVHELTERLGLLVQVVALKADLDAFWAKVEASRGSYHADTGAFVANGNPMMTIPDLNGDAPHVHECTPAPEVPLLRYVDGKSLSARLLVNPDSETWEDIGKIMVTMHRELRLAVGPVAGALRPVFAIHSQIEVKHIESGRTLNFAYTDLNSAYTDLTVGPVPLLHNGRECSAAINYGSGTGIPFPHDVPASFAAYKDVDPWYVLYLPVVPTTVAHYAAMSTSPPNLLPVHLIAYPSDGGSTSWQVSTLGEAIEANLLYATESRLDDLLFADAHTKASKLQEYLDLIEARRQVAEQDLAKRWNLDLE